MATDKKHPPTRRKRQLQRCLRPDCGEPVICRGLCPKDYRIAWELVRDRRTTWARLIATGRALPAQPERRRQRVKKHTITNWLLGKGGGR